MRKIFLLLMAVSVVIFTGCGFSKDNNSDVEQVEDSTQKQENTHKEKQTESVKEILQAVLNSKKTFVDQNGKTIYLKDYKLHDGTLDVTKIEYAFLDFDNDGQTELVLQLSSDIDGEFLVLRYYEDNVYGYDFAYRAMLNLKKDGSFFGSNGATNGDFCKLTFEGSKYKLITEAKHDDANGYFELNGKSVSKEVYDSFVDKWHLKEDVVWTEL